MKKRSWVSGKTLARTMVCVFILMYSLSAIEHATVTVRAGARQEFKGFGASQDWFSEPRFTFTDLSPKVRDSISQFIWGELDFRYMRLWSRSTACPVAYQDNFCADLFGPDFNIQIDYAKKYQPNLKTLLGPCQGLDMGLDNYAAAFAHQIERMYNKHGVEIDYTGIANEPDVGDQLQAFQIPLLIRTFRTELDKKGLHNIKIIAPENTSADPKAQRFVQAALDDPEAFDNLDVISTHSYNWSITDAMETVVSDKILSGEKEYWQTEGGPGPAKAEFDANAEIASDVMAKVLGDMNHLCNVWFFYVGSHGVDADWTIWYNGTQLSRNGWYMIIYRTDYDDFKVLLKCYYFKQLSRIFRPGAYFRKSIAHMNKVDPTKYHRREDTTMVFAYGKKAPLYCAAALNPDGSWGIGMTNYTGFTPNPYSIPRPRMDYRVTVKVEELVGSGDITFNIFRCNAEKGPSPRRFDQYIHDEGTVTMRNGEVTIDSLGQFDLVTLQSQAGINISTGKTPMAGPGQPSVSHNGARIFLTVPPGWQKALDPVKGAVYTSMGKEVQRFEPRKPVSPARSLNWPLVNKRGEKYTPGMYVVRIWSGQEVFEKRLFIP